MYKCEKCEKEFTSYRGLNGHKRLHGDSNGSYSMSRRKTPLPIFNCKNCGKTKSYDPNTTNGTYCSNKCQGEYTRKQNNQKVLNGNGSAGLLKRYLIETFGYKCSMCGISEWNGKNLMLHLDHIDGNSDNNAADNGRILCPNCHSQTDTYIGRNIKNTKRNRYLQKYKSEKKQT